MFGRFRRDRRGSVGVEAVLMFPLLIWAYLAMFVYWEAFRIENTNTKAAYMLADMLSREFNPIDDDYITGMDRVYAFLTRDRFPTDIRVSSIGWDDTTENYRVLWSRSTGDRAELVTEDVEKWATILPVFPSGDTIILVETDLQYEPTFNIGLDNRTMTQFVYMRPRFVSAVPFVGVDGAVAYQSPGGIDPGTPGG
ncbi:Flp pilus assembly protein TadG [Rhodobacteraceae bacterium MBR-64]|jgi:Flp pilus assembly protein TadG